MSFTSSFAISIAGLIACQNAYATCTREDSDWLLKDQGYTVAEARLFCISNKLSTRTESAKAPEDQQNKKASDSLSAGNNSQQPAKQNSSVQKSDAAIVPSTSSAESPKLDTKVFSGSPPNKLNGVIRFLAEAPGFKLVDPRNESEKKASYIVPALTEFKLWSDNVVQIKDGNNTTIEEQVSGRLDVKTNNGKVSVVRDGKITVEALDPSRMYYNDREALYKTANVSQGFTYGILTAPYKFQLSDKSFSSTASLGPYAGYKVSVGDVAMKVIGSVGITSVPVVTSVGSTATSNKTALSISAGVLFDLGNSFEIGALFGTDTVGQKSGYQYNGKPWIAVDIGYKFSN